MKNIISLLVALLMFIPSYLFSFLPMNQDDDFSIVTLDNILLVDGKQAHYELKGENGAFSYDFGTLKTDLFNYFGIAYTSNAYMKGVITYGGKDGKGQEEFFLEPARSGEFYSLIDGFLDGEKMNRLYTITFEPLNKETADFAMKGVGLFNRAIPDAEIYIENDEHKLGIDLARGGAMSYLEDKNSNVEAVIADGVTKVDSDASERYGVRARSTNVNLINANDTGRLVQQSYYGTGDCDQYTGDYFMGNKWNYNPVQGGNQYDDAAKTVDVRIENDSIYIKCRPLDWAKTKEHITPSYMEARYSLSEGLVKAECRFVDFSGYPSAVTTQECPAFYCIEPLNRFVCYSGEEPWTGDEDLYYRDDLIFWPDAGYPNFNATENWAAFTGEFDDSFGLGVFVRNEVSFLAGVYARGECTTKDPAHEGPTSYIAAIESYEFKSFSPTSYEFYLATGTVAEIRENFARIA